MDLPEPLDDFVDKIATLIEDKERIIKDSHDYSSSSYSAHDAGYNEGIYEANTLWLQKCIEYCKVCTECGKNFLHLPDDYKCIYCRLNQESDSGILGP